MENLEDLVDLSIQEIVQPLDQLGADSPTVQSLLQSPPQSPQRIMVVANQPTWRDRTPLSLDSPLHDFPKHLYRVLPNFYLGRGISAEYHLKSFYLALELLNVEDEDVVRRLISYIFEPSASSWFFSLQANSITN